jgi:multidrug efflux system membrane fusion protein|tara:strand:- start:2591 stop:3418 length:828 start_codon:yes stop_codon:yes gene_type:complete
MISGLFVEEKIIEEDKISSFATVAVMKSNSEFYKPEILLKATALSERRVNVRAKTSGEVVKIGARQGEFIKKDFILCSLGVVELNRTEVKSPFSGYIESVVKPGNFIERGQVCATIIQLDPIIFVAEVPEISIAKVKVGQNVDINLITGQKVSGILSFVSKSASPATKTFRVEVEIQNKDGLIKDGLTADLIIKTDKVKAHKISPSILILDDDGKLGVRITNTENIVEFYEIEIVQDSPEGLRATGIPEGSNIIIQGQGFVEEGQLVQITTLDQL